MDLNNDGAFLLKMNLSKDNEFPLESSSQKREVTAVFSLADVNSDGEINYQSCLYDAPCCLNSPAKLGENIHPKNAKDTFDSYDLDGDEENFR